MRVASKHVLPGTAVDPLYPDWDGQRLDEEKQRADRERQRAATLAAEVERLQALSQKQNPPKP